MAFGDKTAIRQDYYSASTCINGISVTDVDGSGSVNGVGFLDRTLSHEFTHADNFSLLPKFIKEGMAELTHGTIFQIAYDDDWLDAGLDLSDTGTGYQDIGDGNAGGFMFLRYFARQAALQSLFDSDSINIPIPITT